MVERPLLRFNDCVFIPISMVGTPARARGRNRHSTLLARQHNTTIHWSGQMTTLLT
ncbi:hypothetical protein M438DRAFT_144491 [Aureobasidium pullulans EXF-150]|uniref:Uncharacterized protein n=1 Tax=Aureobasidium pullulans EXF-150 TaxID=1043002 RepID=A0A074X2G2_AURPU|nr:uncharacterized protein M438DRAFT_144491 [Aureobasidium pullulans EXF-150]KEQ79655.1 hypothetical protein M438DRAFT_144491 [Aureobasidium pullulans EXF-150]